MHDQVARRQVGEGIELLAVRGLGTVLARLAFARGEQLPLRQDGEMQVGIFHAEGQRAVGEQDLPRLRQLRQREGEKGRELLFAKLLGKNLSAAAVAAQNERGKLVFLVELQVGCRRVQIAAIGGKLLGRDADERLGLQALRIRGGEEGVEKRGRAALKAAAQALPVRGEFAQLPTEDARLQQAVEHHALLLGLTLRGAAQVAMVAEKDHAFRRDVVRGAGKFRIDQGKITVGGGEAGLAAQQLRVGGERFDQRLVGDLAALLPRAERVKLVRKTGRALRMQLRQCFRDGQQHQLVRIFRAALSDEVEKAHGVHLVAEEFDADGLIIGGRINVQNSAADGELPHALDQRAAGIAGAHQTGRQLLRRAGRAGLQRQRGGKQQRFRHGAQGERFPCDDLHGRRAARKVVELAQALVLPAARDRGGVVEGQIARGEDGRFRAEKGGQLRLCAPRG